MGIKCKLNITPHRYTRRYNSLDDVVENLEFVAAAAEVDAEKEASLEARRQRQAQMSKERSASKEEQEAWDRAGEEGVKDTQEWINKINGASDSTGVNPTSSAYATQWTASRLSRPFSFSFRACCSPLQHGVSNWGGGGRRRPFRPLRHAGGAYKYIVLRKYSYRSRAMGMRVGLGL